MKNYAPGSKYGLTIFFMRDILSVCTFYARFKESGETDVSLTQNPDYEAYVKGYFAAWPKVWEDLLQEYDPYRHPVSIPWPQSLPEIKDLYFGGWINLLFRACCWVHVMHSYPRSGSLQNTGRVNFLCTLVDGYHKVYVNFSRAGGSVLVSGREQRL